MRFLPKLIFIILFVGCNSNNKDENSLVDFTAEIQLGIENHIEKQSLIGHGFFKLEFEEKELNLKLVKVHTLSCKFGTPRTFCLCRSCQHEWVCI